MVICSRRGERELWFIRLEIEITQLLVWKHKERTDMYYYDLLIYIQYCICVLNALLLILTRFYECVRNLVGSNSEVMNHIQK